MLLIHFVLLTFGIVCVSVTLEYKNRFIARRFKVTLGKCVFLLSLTSLSIIILPLSPQVIHLMFTRSTLLVNVTAKLRRGSSVKRKFTSA